MREVRTSLLAAASSDTEKIAGPIVEYGTAVRGEQPEPPDVALPDPASDRLTAGKAEPSGRSGDVPRARQLEQGQRVAVTLLDELVTDGGIDRAGDADEQKGAGIAIGEAVNGDLRQPGQGVTVGPRPRGIHDRDPLGQQAAGHEPHHLGRGLIEPLPVVDNADQRLLLGDLGGRRQRGQPDQQPVGRGAELRPSTVARASRCGTGSRPRWSSMDLHS